MFIYICVFYSLNACAYIDMQEICMQFDNLIQFLIGKIKNEFNLFFFLFGLN